MTDYELLSKTELAAVLDRLADEYYNGQPSVDDATYDAIEAFYTTQYGQRVKVGAPVNNTHSKRVLKRQMYSLNKATTAHALKLWLAKYPPPYYVMDKVDGISLQQYQTELSTRGDGVVGSNVDHLFAKLQLPVSGDSFVRGELVLPRSVFSSTYAKTYANARNSVAGAVNATVADAKLLDDLLFLAYDYVAVGTERVKQSEQMQQLQRLGYHLPYGELCNELDFAQLQQLLLRRKAEADYEIDGLVIVSDHLYPEPVAENPRHAIAFKLEGETTDTVVKGVEWNISKHGLYKPRINIEPVQLDGVTISWLTGFNARFIIDNQLGAGAEVTVIRSGAVIPYCKAVLKPAPGGAELPATEWAWLQRKRTRPVSERASPPPNAETMLVEGVEVYVWYETSDVDICTVTRTDEQQIKYLSEFFKTLGAKHLGEATIAKLYTAGYRHVKALLGLTVELVLQVSGFQQKGAERVVQAIQSVIKGVNLARLAAASGVFGNGFGEKKIAQVLQVRPDLLQVQWERAQLLLVLQQAGLQTTANQFADALPVFKSFLQEHSEFTLATPVVTVTKCESVSSGSASQISGKTVVFSGTRSKELEALVLAKGGRVTSAVSGKTDYLVVAVAGSNSGKELKAKELGVAVITKEQLQLLC